MDKTYIDTVRLLLEVAPAVFEEGDFALKGGTGINLFIEEMPRLSVDIDVVFTDHHVPRRQALGAISSSLRQVAARLSEQSMAVESPTSSVGGEVSKLFVRRDSALVKVEVNHIFRGTVLDVASRTLVDRAQDFFITEISLPVLSESEIYGSKLVAAMDRQHPRDLFDVLGMFRRGGLTPEIVECFVCYLAGHNRPLHEVLFARKQDIAPAFENEFQGMTRELVELDALLEARERLFQELPAALTENHRRFLVGLVECAPGWDAMRCPHLSELPAVRWKLENLAKLQAADSERFAEQASLLRAGLEAV